MIEERSASPLTKSEEPQELWSSFREWGARALTTQELKKALVGFDEDLPIIPLVSSSITEPGEKPDFYCAQVTYIAAGTFAEYENGVYTSDPVDLDALKSAIMHNSSKEEYADLEGGAFGRWLEAKVAALNWHKAILIYIVPHREES